MPRDTSQTAFPLLPPIAAGGGPVTVLVNTTSGRAGRDRVERLRAALAARIDPARLDIVAGRPGRLIRRAHAAAGVRGPVVVCGGDGTIAGVAEALAASRTPLAVIPGGTFNYFARGLGIPEDLEAAAALAATGTPRPVAVGQVNGRLFLNNASLGLYPDILQTREGIYDRWGRSRPAAYWSVLSTMARYRGPMRLEVHANGTTERIRTPLAFFANSSYQLARFGLDPAEAVAAGKLALLIAPDDTATGLMRRALRLAMGQASRHDDYRVIVAERFRVSIGRKRTPVARDGEHARMSAPFDVDLRPDALQVITGEAGAAS